MVSFCFSVLITANPAAVLFDLRRLEYTWGDAIGGLAHVLLQDGEARLRKALPALSLQRSLPMVPQLVRCDR